ncbi:MAG: ATP--guanido phosphotransferase [Armatimonadetes bacterium]|nr:ATP--guanido phosphotransferase [Armatimonadota bacterium]
MSRIPPTDDAPWFPAQPAPDELRRLDMEWLRGEGQHASVVVTSRVRVARNLKGYRFPPAASPTELNRVLGEVIGAVTRQSCFDRFHVLDTAQLSELDLHMLMEKHLISPHFVKTSQQRSPGRGLVLGPRGGRVGMINEEDHLRLQAIRSGLELEACWEELGKVDDALEAELDFSWSDQLGYLSTCPTNLGTAMRASVLLHLPGLSLKGRLDAIRSQIASQVGLSVRGLYGEGSGVLGNLLQISNQISLGPAEEDLIGMVRGMAGRIIEQEMMARQEIRRDNSVALFDKVWRALGVMRHAQTMDFPEALSGLSLVRLGVEMEILPPIPRERLNELMVSVRPAMLQVLMGQVSDPLQADMIRAQRIRQELAEAP